MILNGKSSQEYTVKAGVFQHSILGTMLFLPYINDLLGDLSVTMISMLMILLFALSTLCVIKHLIFGNK